MSHMPCREFKIVVIKILTGLKKTVKDFCVTLKKEMKNIKKNQSKIKNSITEIKYTVEGKNTLEE